MIKLIILAIFLSIASVEMQKVMYVGSFSSGTISMFTMDDMGKLALKGSVNGGMTPTWLDAQKGFLYGTNEENGYLVGLKIGPGGTLTVVSRQLSYGNNPTFLTVDPSGKYLLVANYGTGSDAVFEIKNGAIGDLVNFEQHYGHGAVKDRQEGPHAHQIIFDPSKEYVFSADLGTDKVYQYKFDNDTGSLIPNSYRYCPTEPGDGPRHLAFHPSGKFAYLACELSSMIITLSFNPGVGTLTSIQRLPTIPNPNPKNAPAEIVVLPSGRFVYVSNRGENTIAVFAVGADGTLTLVEYHPNGAANPRGMILDADSKIIYTFNQDAGNIIAHSVDFETGKLTFKAIAADNLEAPVCGVIMKVE